MKLIKQLEPADVSGTVTILPAVNQPAVMAARRRSPLDDGNLNRVHSLDPPTGNAGHQRCDAKHAEQFLFSTKLSSVDAATLR